MSNFAKLSVALLIVFILSTTVLEAQSRWLAGGTVMNGNNPVAFQKVELEIFANKLGFYYPLATVYTDANGQWTHTPDMVKYPYSEFSTIRATATHFHCHTSTTRSPTAPWSTVSGLHIQFQPLNECRGCIPWDIPKLDIGNFWP